MKKYVVSSPLMAYTGFDISDNFSCVFRVEATSRTEARLKAYRSKEFSDWVELSRNNGNNPFTGMKVEEVV